MKSSKSEMSCFIGTLCYKRSWYIRLFVKSCSSITGMTSLSKDKQLLIGQEQFKLEMTFPNLLSYTDKICYSYIISITMQLSAVILCDQHTCKSSSEISSEFLETCMVKALHYFSLCTERCLLITPAKLGLQV
jgi:hypothetical protein